ncbi:MAG: V-type ATP synthase subunit E family protein [Candidatus Marinimicrobia bacterium]|nr:V-type ATP synthase subunit E family protein [Candidatus Neomarinimicrobiota bacterium]
MTDHKSSLEMMIRDIRQESQEEVDAVLSQSAKEVEDVRNKAKTEAEKIRSEIVRKAEKQAESDSRRILSGVHLEVKRLMLKDQNTILTEILRQATIRLEEFRHGSAYVTFLKELVLEGIAGLGNDVVHILTGDLEKRLLTDEFLESITDESEKTNGKKVRLIVSPETLADSGVILISDNGRVRFDNRLSIRLQRVFDELQWAIMKEFIETDLKEK